jgi:transcriptional regulator with XRE-family HTH domain
MDERMLSMRCFLPVPRTQPAIDTALATVLRRMREEQHQTQEDVAFAAGVTTGSVSRIELSQMNPTWGMVRKIADALGVNVTELAEAVEREER